MTRKNKKIIEAVARAFEIRWGEFCFVEDIGTEKIFEFNNRSYTMFPEDYEVMLQVFNLVMEKETSK